MTRRKFLYYLTDANDKSYFIQNGLVVKSANPVPLQYSPSGWRDQSLKWARNQTYHGLIPSYTIPLRFIKDSAQIIRNQFYQKGTNEVMYLIIHKLNKTTGKHEGYFKGELNFVKYKDSKHFFEVNVTETGFYKMLKAYENTAFEIPLTNAVEVEMDGLTLQKKTNFAIVDGYEFGGIYTVGCAYANEEGTSFGYITGNSPLSTLAGWGGAAVNDDRWIIKNISTAPIVFQIKGELRFTLQGPTNETAVRIELSNNPGVAAAVIVPWQVRQPGDYTITVDTTLTIPAGQRAFIIGLLRFSGPSNWGVQFRQTTLSFITQTKFKTTKVIAQNAEQVADALAKKMAGTDYSVDSSLLRNCGIYLTCGDAIRGLPNPVLKTTWKDFFSSFNRNNCLGMIVQGKVIKIVPRDQCYIGTTIYDLGEASDGFFEIKEEWLGSSIKIGYPNQDYDDVNGKDEFNNTHVYKTPLSRVTTTIDLTAKYRADPYGIEFIRINLEGKTTTDNKGDSEIFMLDVVNDAGIFKLNRPGYQSITGILNADTIYNTRLSPKNLFYIHERWFRSILWKEEANKVTYETSEKNSLLSTTLNGVTIKENADVAINSLKNPYFYPMEFKGKFQVPANIQLILSSGNNVKFKFTWLDKDWYGYLMDASQKPSDNEEQEWTLLLTIDNDLTQLIHG